ncbi:amidase family protein [Vagococcus lutrae]|uniref:amidase family protein n=1 Tax=Vagococcus lutrae TaxID=81947 RepID=UPI001928D275|nr:amidase family protein [Vagococcus lutrae]MDT2842137.1 amidase family protein [Vagococcus lutrae]UQF11064.1 amidase family protein [Vagococcus lutrae]UQF22712.1 amidase family protein [Vagococcus lutrae]UQF63368.1 amidase family protein [Vagococcus lutrae]GEQ61391.1 hypothetical protein VL2N_07270 [Vagococcus lutrae]
MSYRIKSYAKKTFLAMDNRYKSVKKVYPNSIDQISQTSGYFMGIKEVQDISEKFISRLNKLGFINHTVDKASLSGRAIDLDLINPLTGNYMTGSSSGTALNVFLEINDLGVGTDGGGSVLAPAMSLNLYGFIHPELGKEVTSKEEVKTSTDGVAFFTSIGLIAKELELIECVIENEFVVESKEGIIIATDTESLLSNEKLINANYNISLVDMPDKFIKERENLIKDLTNLLEHYDIVISKEGPVDVQGFGDTIFGHFSKETKTYQQMANKGFIRVANMVNAVSLCVPTTQLGEGYVIMTKNKKALSHLINIGKKIKEEQDLLSKNYFSNHSKYFEMGV